MILCILSVAFILTASAEETNENEILMNYSFSEPIINNANISNITYHEVLMDSSPSYGDVNQPILPMKPSRILLPQKGIVKSINVTYEGNTSLGNGYNVTLGAPANKSDFNTSNPYPTEGYSCNGISYFRGYSILEICINPVYYIGDTKEIYYYKYINVTITTNTSGSTHSLFRGLEQDEILMKQIVDDFSMNYTYNSTLDPPVNTSLINYGDEYDYLILTSNRVINPESPTGARNWKTFQDLALHKNENEINTIVQTVEEIYESGEYNGVDNQETIRNYIKHAYSAWGIEYVLLGGDVKEGLKKIIPARYLFYSTTLKVSPKQGELPSDLYYACLDGSFNENDDAVYGVNPYKWWGTPFDGSPYGDWYEPHLKMETWGIESNGFYAEADSDENNIEFDVGLFTPSLDLSGSDNAARIVFFYNGLIGEGVHLYIRAYSDGIEGICDFEIFDIEGTETGEFGHSFPVTEFVDKENVYFQFRYKDEIVEDDDSSFNFDKIKIIHDGNTIFSYNFEEEWVEDSDGDLAPPNWEVIKYNENGGTWEQEYYRVDIDLTPEVFVGRAPVGNPEEVSNFVYKTITYEETPPNDPYISKVLMVGSLQKENTNDFGGIRKDRIRKDKCNHEFLTYGIPDIYDNDTLYDMDYENYHWDKEILWNKLNIDPNAHIININHHGLKHALIYPGTNEERLNNDHIKDKIINNDNYFFIWANSCWVGWFDYEDCLAEYLTVKTEHGAFAVIMNARWGYGSSGNPNTQSETDMLDRVFFNELYYDYTVNEGEIPKLGKAHHLSSLNPNIRNILERKKHFVTQDMRMAIYELNLFGDPTIQLKLPEVNQPPVTPDSPSFYKLPFTDIYCFYTNTTDPEDLKVSYNWEWDGVVDDYWSDYIKSADTIYRFKKLSPGEQYQVRVRARDEVLEPINNWSQTLIVQSPFNLNINMESSLLIVGESADFYGQASSGTQPYTAWNWDFGDSNYSQQQNTSNVYSSVGDYNITLNVTDSQNISSNITKTISVVILNADFESSLGLAVSNKQETFNFNDKSKGYYEIVNWSWDLGDGNTSYDRNTSHVYSSEGAYTVSLTVTDTESNTDSFYQIIYIDSVSPTISSISNDVNVVGYGSNVTISVNTSDNSCGVKSVNVNITYPNNYYVNYSINNTGENIYEHDFSNCWQFGEYSYSILVVDQANNSNCVSENNFVVTRSLGFKAIGRTNQTIRNTITGSRFKVYEKGVADNISVYLDSGNATSESHYQCLIYRHNDSKLIGISEQKNVSIGKGWQTFNFSVPKPILINDTEYILCCWSDDNYSVTMYFNNGTGSPMYYDDGNSAFQGHYYKGIYGYPPPINNFKHEDRKYSICCSYTPDNTTPEITNVSDTPDTVGFGFNITISADIFETQSGVDIIKVNITYPNSTQYIYNMNHLENDTYNLVFNNTWLKGQYNYSIWTVDYANNSNISTGYSFNVSGQATISVCTIKDSYGTNEIVNLTDPPSSSYQIGYELLDNSDVLHIWNNLDNYYFDTDSGIQLTNHYNEYWSHNVLMLGYYNNDEWNLIYRTDELSGFNKDIESDNETYVNATLWKDLSYGGYAFRLAIRYNLGVDDNDLTVIPYIKNIDQDDIPYVLGFGWEIKDIQINMTISDDYIDVNRTMYNLNQTLDNVYSNLTETEFYLMENITDSKTKSLYLKWNQSLNYKLQVKSRTGQYNAPVTLFIKIGTLDAGQEKYTEMYWYDADQVIYYFDSYDDSPYGEAWAAFPGYMVDGSISNSASTTSNGDVELCTGNNCSGTDLGTILNVALRVKSYYSGYQRDTILRPVFGGTNDGADHHYQTVVIDTWSQWFDITYDPFAPQSWTWSDVDNLDCDVVAENDPYAPPFTLYCSKVEIRVSYVPYNNEPEIVDPVPANGASGVGIQPVLNITVTDSDGDNMNITWLSNSSGSWQTFGTNNSVSDGTYHQTFSNATSNGQWWYWKVNVSDGEDYKESSVYKFYTGCQSKIKNTGSTNIKGYLLIQVQYYNTSSSTWIVASDTINETTPRTINSSEQFGLDTVFNGNVNTTYLINNFGTGTYRVYAAFREPDGDVLICDDQSLMETSYQFTVTTS